MTFEEFKNQLDRATTEEVVKATYESQSRFEGEFYTPLRFAQKAIHYFEDVLGKNCYKTGKYRIWDMAAGTGNLEYHLPAEAYKYLYLSTLHAGEADHAVKKIPKPTWLNDRNQFLIPLTELSKEFINDCIIWSLFSYSNVGCKFFL